MHFNMIWSNRMSSHTVTTVIITVSFGVLRKWIFLLLVSLLSRIICLRCITMLQMDAFTVHHSSSWNKKEGKSCKINTIYLLFRTMKHITVVTYIQLHRTIFVEKPTVHWTWQPTYYFCAQLKVFTFLSVNKNVSKNYIPNKETGRCWTQTVHG